MQESSSLSVEELRAKAARYCAGSEQCCFSVRKKLREWGATDEQVAEVLEWLIDQRFVDDRRFAMAYASSKLRYQQWGHRKVEAEMRRKQIASSIIAEALAQVPDDEYREIATKVALSKLKSLKADSMCFDRLCFFLLTRGYEDDVAHAVVRDVTKTKH